MWICIEIQTDDLEIWSTVDRLLSTELGCTHIIWGVNKEENNKPVGCKLPSNLFYVDTTYSESDLKSEIIKLLKPLRLRFSIIVIDKSWSYDNVKAPIVIKYDQDDKEIMEREA